MKREVLTDLDDPRLDVYRHLKTTNRARDLGLFVVEGQMLAKRLLASRYQVASVVVTDRREEELAPLIAADVPLYVVPDALVSELVGFSFHRGVLACGLRQEWPGLAELVQKAGPRVTLLVCSRIDHPENLGMLIRIGDVFGIDAVVVGERCPDPLSRRVLRTSMGSALRVPVVGFPGFEEMDRLGLDLVAAVADGSAQPLDEFRRPDRLGLVVGSESDGLDPHWLAACSRRITIPMRPGVDSLNVAVAAGILLYHLKRPGATHGDG